MFREKLSLVTIDLSPHIQKLASTETSLLKYHLKNMWNASYSWLGCNNSQHWTGEIGIITFSLNALHMLEEPARKEEPEILVHELYLKSKNQKNYAFF